MKSYILTFLLILSSHIYANSPCNEIYLNGKWTSLPGIIQKIQGRSIPGGFSLVHSKMSPLYFTEYFLTESGLILPEGTPIDLLTYRYHRNGTKISWFLPGKDTAEMRSHRGGGRDHIIDSKTSISVKGSGTNPYFSKSNKEDFNLQDFRRNGLFLLDEGVTSYILAKNLKALNVNVVEIPDLVLVPEEFHNLVHEGKPSKNYMVQLHRKMTTARESLENKNQPNENHHHKSKGIHQLASDLLLFNIAHGAINPENMGMAGEIIDLGHVTFGYPFMSFNYRCTLCKGMEGGSSDRTLIGILDHYWGNNLYSRERERSYSFKLKNNDVQRILESTVKRLSGIDSTRKITLPQITKREFSAINELFKENFELWGKNSTSFFYEDFLTKQYNKIFDAKIAKETNDLPNPWDDGWPNVDNDPFDNNSTLPPFSETNSMEDGDWNGLPTANLATPIDQNFESWSYIWPAKKSLSYRFLWRVVAQKKYLKPESYQALKKNVLELVTPKKKEDLNITLNFFEEIIELNQLKRKDFNVLFQEFMPTNLIQKRVGDILSQVQNYQDISSQVSTLITELTKPIPLPAAKFRLMVESLVKTLEKKKVEYQKEALDKVNQDNGSDHFF